MQHPEKPTPEASELRSIEARVAGQQHGPIARLISPGDLGERLKPFIFLDFFNAEIKPGFGFGIHPHSGIATLTWQPGSDVRYQDTTGKNGVLKAGGLEWMGGVNIKEQRIGVGFRRISGEIRGRYTHLQRKLIFAGDQRVALVQTGGASYSTRRYTT